MKSIGERALKIYERLKPELEKTHCGKWMVINVETEEYIIADTDIEAAKLCHQKFPAAPASILKIGDPIVRI